MSDDAYNPACMICAGACQPRYFSLYRAVERTVASGASVVETVINATFCESCGPAGALEMLRRDGLTPLSVTADPPRPLCTKCHGRFIDAALPHLVYTVELDELDGGNISPIEQLWHAPSATSATPPSWAQRQDFFEFPMTQKHLIVGNYKPRLKGVELALARQFALVRFSGAPPRG